MSEMDGVERLYRNYEILSEAKDKILEHEKEYLEILAAVKGTNNEKRLASQFIGRFFKFFPEKVDQAIYAQLDLCEDDDISIRKQAIKDLPALCKDNTEYLPKIADVLTQLLQTDDNQELVIVHNAIMTLFKVDEKGTLGGLFSQILTGEDIVRERAVKFLSQKIKILTSESLSKEVEEYIMTESKKVLEDVTGEEFVIFINILLRLKMSHSLAGQQALMDIVKEQAELDKRFEPTEPDCVDKLIQCIKQAMPLFSMYAPSTAFVKYITLEVLPVLHEIGKVQDEATEQTNPENVRIEILHLLAEMSSHCAELENEDCMQKVFNKLLELMPLPSTEDTENINNDLESKLEFSSVECLMFTLHQIGKKHPDFLSPEKNPERMKDFRIRLQYFARHVQGYVKELRDVMSKKKDGDLKSEENKLKVIALKTTTNINTLVRDLFHNPPSYKSNITLSWKTPTVGNKPKTAPVIDAVPSKRSNKTPITFDDDATPAKKFVKGNQREIYTPPSGKYSNKVSKFHGEGRGGYQRGGRFRGRGRY